MAKLSKKPYAREDESLDQYLQEIGEVDLLTADEEVTLAKRINQGNHNKNDAKRGSPKNVKL